MTHSIDQLMACTPCYSYPRERIEALLPDPFSAEDVAALAIANTDRVWALIALLDDRHQRLFACDCADRALGRVATPDPRSVAAVVVARRFANGDATVKELNAARYAAWTAAGGAAGGAAGYAAVYAAGYGAWSAATSAAWDAARDAARSAAWDAEREWQLTALVAAHNNEGDDQ